MTKLSVSETKWSSLLARTRALILYISIWKFDFGPEKLPGLSRNGPLAPLLRFPLTCSSFSFKKSALTCYMYGRWLRELILSWRWPYRRDQWRHHRQTIWVDLAFSNHSDQPLDSSKLSDETSKSCYDFFFNNSTFFRRNWPYATVDIIF